MSAIFGVLFLAVVGTTLGVPIPEPVKEELLHGWVPAPRSRGTFNIITSCVVTLVLCVWTAIHPDVVHNVKPWQRYRKKIGWMFKALLAPDRVIIHSYNQRQEAKRIHQFWLDEDKVKQRPKALKEHLNSGLLKYGPNWIERDDAPGPVGVRSGGDLLGIEGAFFLVMCGYSMGGKPLSLKEFEDLALWQIREVGGQLKRLDVIDKGKASALAKVISCLQASWLVLQLLARKAAGLPVTQFELHVFVQVLITSGLYWFWWEKSLDVNEPIEIFRVSGPDLPLDNKLSPKIPKLLDFMDTLLLLEPLLNTFPWFSKAPGKSPGLSYEHSKASVKSLEVATESLENSPEEAPGLKVWDILGENCPGLVFYLLYGGLHTLAWNSQFPTLVECWLWRASCLVVAAAPAGLVIDMCIRCRFYNMSLKGFRGFLHFSLTILYTMSSMFLLVESFIGLRQLPSGAYETVPWGNYIPHF